MSNESVLLPVTLGLGAGVALIILLSLTLKTNLPPTDNQVISAANNFPETHVFLSKFMNATTKVDRTGTLYGTADKVMYQYAKMHSDGRLAEARMLIELNPLTGMPSHGTINIYCATVNADGTGMSLYGWGPSAMADLESENCST